VDDDDWGLEDMLLLGFPDDRRRRRSGRPPREVRYRPADHTR
jgi:hypothetical protein